MNVNEIRNGLKEYDNVDVDRFINYIWGELNAQKKGGGDKNPWMKNRGDMYFVDSFKEVASTGLILDGVHITIQNRGISYDYQAYKNKMLLAYPESFIDVDLVYDGDEFSFSKDSGSVSYSHEIKYPFAREDKNVIGGYCVIKNKRGEFLTLLTRAEIDKHRKVAKTDYIWADWFAEMSRKTVIKKACKGHFEDVFQRMNTEDNKQSDIDNSVDIDLQVKADIEKTETVEELQIYWEDNKSDYLGTWFGSLVMSRKKEIIGDENEDS